MEQRVQSRRGSSRGEDREEKVTRVKTQPRFALKPALLRDWLLHKRCIFMSRRSRVKREPAFVPDDIID